jgi:hypothetical protein
MNKKVIASLVILCFFLISVNYGIVYSEPLEDQTNICYGFIVPMIRYENSTIGNQINCKIRNLINDFLREEIPVYWTTTNITILIREIHPNENEREMFFEKGTFMILFTGNTSIDIKITVMMCDYNHSSEIEDDNKVKVSVYLLQELLTDVQVYPLSEVKLAVYSSRVNVGEVCYYYIARECGFLNIECLDRSNINKLNTDNYNIIARVGAAPEKGYASFCYSGFFYSIYEDFRFDTSNKIREFVRRGGGYIGSCDGAEKASSGIRFIEGFPPIYFGKLVHNSELRSYGLYAIADIIFIPNAKLLGTRNHLYGAYQVEIVNDSNPLSYSLDSITWDCPLGGPQFEEPLSENTQVVARFVKCNSSMNNTPSWVSSTFGDGRTVLFASHPEIASYWKHNDSYFGNTIISNVLFYTTSKDMIVLNTLQSRTISFIIDVWDKTSNLLINNGEYGTIFDGILNKINETICQLHNLKENYSEPLIKYISDVKDFRNLTQYNKDRFLGFASISWASRHYLEGFIKDLQDATINLETFTKIYPLLENYTEIVKEIDSLKADLSERLDKTMQMCDEGLQKCKEYRGILDSYNYSLSFFKPSKLIPRMREFKLESIAHQFYLSIFSGFNSVPQTFFNSLKCLRESWYYYEVNCAI